MYQNQSLNDLLFLKKELEYEITELQEAIRISIKPKHRNKLVRRQMAIMESLIKINLAIQIFGLNPKILLIKFKIPPVENVTYSIFAVGVEPHEANVWLNLHQPSGVVIKAKVLEPGVVYK